MQKSCWGTYYDPSFFLIIRAALITSYISLVFSTMKNI